MKRGGVNSGTGTSDGLITIVTDGGQGVGRVNNTLFWKELSDELAGR